MVDAARQMLDELMGRNRNLHPKFAKKISWEDPEFCQYYIVKFCPHELFINTRADLGPCSRLHDDEARKLYEDAHPSSKKKHYEDEFLRFCNTMLNEVDRKIQKGKQRLQLMRKDQPPANSHLSKYQEQVVNLEARIKKLVSEAEEAGIRGDVDQARDLMILCDQLREEKETLITQRKQQANDNFSADGNSIQGEDSSLPETPVPPSLASLRNESEKSPKSDVSGEAKIASEDGSIDTKTSTPWSQDASAAEKQMEVCETCGAFLIVGDAQQRIEDHLMGKQHMGYSKLRSAVAEIYERRQKEREDEDRKRREERANRAPNGVGRDRRGDYCHRDRERDRERERVRERERDRDNVQHNNYHNNYYHSERHRRHHSKSHHHTRSHRHSSRSRSRSRY